MSYAPGILQWLTWSKMQDEDQLYSQAYQPNWVNWELLKQAVDQLSLPEKICNISLIVNLLIWCQHGLQPRG